MESLSGDTSSSPANIAPHCYRPQQRAVPTFSGILSFIKNADEEYVFPNSISTQIRILTFIVFVISYKLHNNPIKVMKRTWNEKFYYSSVVCHDSRLNSSHLDVYTGLHQLFIHWKIWIFQQMENTTFLAVNTITKFRSWVGICETMSGNHMKDRNFI